MLSRFHSIQERNGRTDGWTELLYRYRASVCWRAIQRLRMFSRCFSQLSHGLSVCVNRFCKQSFVYSQPRTWHRPYRWTEGQSVIAMWSVYYVKQLMPIICHFRDYKALMATKRRYSKCSDLFIARQHTDARYWYSKSVRPSVCPWRSGIRWKRLNILS